VKGPIKPFSLPGKEKKKGKKKEKKETGPSTKLSQKILTLSNYLINSFIRRTHQEERQTRQD